MWWLIVLFFVYIVIVVFFRVYVRFVSHKSKFDANSLPLVIEPWYFPFFGPILSMLDLGKALKQWQKKYGESFTVRILGKYLTFINKDADLRRFYHATEESLSLTRAAASMLGSVYPEGQYIVEYSAVPFLQTIMTPNYLQYMSTNIEQALFDYLNPENGHFWVNNGDESVIDLFPFMYELVLRSNCLNFASPRIYKAHVNEWIDLFSRLDAEKNVMNPIAVSLKEIFGFRNQRQIAWARWIELLMPDIERCCKMIDLGIEPNDIDIPYTTVKYAKEELEKRGKKFTPRLVAFFVYSSFLPAQLNTYATASYVLIEWMQHQHDKIGQQIREELENVPPPGELTLEALDRMEYIQACIYEVIRLRTYTQLVLRHAGQNVTLSDGKTIPSGNLVATLWGSNPTAYPDHERFDPERQLSPRDEGKKDPYRTLPFGRGKHVCTGERYAKMQIKIILLQMFRLCRLDFVDKSLNLEQIVDKKQLASLTRLLKPVYIRISKKI